MYYKYIVVPLSDYQCMYVNDENESKRGRRNRRWKRLGRTIKKCYKKEIDKFRNF